MPVKIVSIGDDLFFWSQIHDAARQAGRTAIRIADEAALNAAASDGEVGLVLADLAFRGVDSIAWAARWAQASSRPRLVGYASHVDVDTHERARAAGFDQVLPKSRFQRELIKIVGAADLAMPPDGTLQP